MCSGDGNQDPLLRDQIAWTTPITPQNCAVKAFADLMKICTVTRWTCTSCSSRDVIRASTLSDAACIVDTGRL